VPDVTVQVEVRIQLQQGAHSSASQAPSHDQAMSVVEQCRDDALDGTFGRLPQASRPPRRIVTTPRLSNVIIGEPANGSRLVRFTLHLPAQVFGVSFGGFQHLIGILIGDAFPSQVGPCELKDVKVEHLDLPAEMMTDAQQAFHRNQRNIGEIRSSFNIVDPEEPLVAFSFKPRVNFDLAWATEVTRDVVGAGIRLVEFDTRKLQDPSIALSEGVQLARIANEEGRRHGRTATFAPNFSHPSYIAVPLASEWCASPEVKEPHVIKVDGGLDGLSTVQGIRMAGLGREPIVTTYPLFRRAIDSYLGTPDTWVELLAVSGVDIVYPGNRPAFPQDRSVGGDTDRSLALSVERYDKLIQRRWPLPTFAAGAHPGHLQVAYELLGPDVAYFLGGAIALHPSGPKAGAKLCVSVLENARELADKARKRGRPFADDLPSKLIEEIEYYKGGDEGGWYYIPPRSVFKGRIETFYRR
jgi:ribulose 1,5-bisphosphate carboxylase large subunit-like protein